MTIDALETCIHCVVPQEAINGMAMNTLISDMGGGRGGGAGFRFIYIM